MKKLIILLALLIIPAEAFASDNTVGRIFQERCMACHGVYGNGKGVLAEHLDPKPRNFTSYDEMTHLSGDTVAIETVIREGSHGTAMPAFGNSELDGDPLTAAQITSLAKYVQSFLAEEQYLLQLCVGPTFTFDTELDRFKIQVSNKDLMVNKNKSLIRIHARNAKRLASSMVKDKKRATRRHFKILEDDRISLLMTVRFNYPCTDKLKKTKGYELTKTF
jgi:hypothetical protein